MFTLEAYVRGLEEDTPRRYGFTAGSTREVVEWQYAFRHALRRALGLEVIRQRVPTAPPSAQRLSVEQLEDHVREDWLLETEPGVSLPFYLLRPLGTDGPLPVVITPHGHEPGGRQAAVGIAQSEEIQRAVDELEQDVARQAVRRGYLAIAPGMRGLWEMRLPDDLRQGTFSSCARLQYRALLFGRTLLGERVWDMTRLIDWAISRQEVDARRIAITGNSGGGTVSLFTAAVDERVGVCVPSCYFCTFIDSIGLIEHCACNYVPGLLALGEMADVAGLVAPRPFMAVCGEADPIFPIEASRRAFGQLREIYELLGAGDLCRLSAQPGGHRYYGRDVWPFLREVWGV